MPGFAIKKLPAGLYRRLKRQAARNRRSVAEEVLVVLEQALGAEIAASEPPPPFRGRFPLTARFLDKAKRAGRQ